MFINSKKTLLIRTGDKVHRIEKGFIGEISDELAKHWMIQAAISDGSIATPQGKSDRKLEQADVEAELKTEASDIRPEDLTSEAPAKTADKDPEGKKPGK